MECKYVLDEIEAPYPRVSYISECGFQLVMMEGYEYNEFSGRTSKFKIPSGKCLKCKKEIVVELPTEEQLEVQKPSHNTGSLKLPTIEEVRNALPPAPADWGCDEETAVEILNYGAESAYEFICRQLQAGA